VFNCCLDYLEVLSLELYSQRSASAAHGKQSRRGPCRQIPNLVTFFLQYGKALIKIIPSHVKASGL